MMLRLDFQVTQDVGDAVVEVNDAEGSSTADLLVAVGGDTAVIAEVELRAIVEVATAIVEEAGLGDLGDAKGKKNA